MSRLFPVSYKRVMIMLLDEIEIILLYNTILQVMKVQQTIVVKCPNLAVPYRRLVCYCRLYEVTDKNKKDRPGK